MKHYQNGVQCDAQGCIIDSEQTRNGPGSLLGVVYESG